METPLTGVLKHFAQFLSLTNSKNFYVYMDLYKEIFAHQSLICT